MSRALPLATALAALLGGCHALEEQAAVQPQEGPAVLPPEHSVPVHGVAPELDEDEVAARANPITASPVVKLPWSSRIASK